MRASLSCVIGAACVVAAAGLATPVSAQNLNSVVGSLNSVLNPGDAQRYEDQARRNGRADEERYWRDYRVGLEGQPRGPAASGPRIGIDQARVLEEQARRDGRWEDERYWRNYSAGLEGRPAGRDSGPPMREPVQYSGHIGSDQAFRLEEQARRNGRWDEARYWASYRAGLEGRVR